MMEDKTSDQSRGMAPSEMMQKLSAIDPEGLLGDSGENGDNGDQEQEMQETRSRGSEEMEEADNNPAIHRNIHVVSTSEEEGSEGEKDGKKKRGCHRHSNRSGSHQGGRYRTSRTRIRGNPRHHSCRSPLI